MTHVSKSQEFLQYPLDSTLLQVSADITEQRVSDARRCVIESVVGEPSA